MGPLEELVGRTRRLEQIPARPHGADNRTQGLDPTPQPKDSHIQRVALSHALRPGRDRELGAAHDRAEPLDQHRCQSCLGRRYRDPGCTHKHQSVLVNRRGWRLCPAGAEAGLEPVHPREAIDFQGRNAYPLFALAQVGRGRLIPSSTKSRGTPASSSRRRRTSSSSHLRVTTSTVPASMARKVRTRSFSTVSII